MGTCQDLEADRATRDAARDLVRADLRVLGGAMPPAGWGGQAIVGARDWVCAHPGWLAGAGALAGAIVAAVIGVRHSRRRAGAGIGAEQTATRAPAPPGIPLPAIEGAPT